MQQFDGADLRVTQT